MTSCDEPAWLELFVDVVVDAAVDVVSCCFLSNVLELWTLRRTYTFSSSAIIFSSAKNLRHPKRCNLNFSQKIYRFLFLTRKVAALAQKEWKPKRWWTQLYILNF